MHHAVKDYAAAQTCIKFKLAELEEGILQNQSH
jgi:hypothetical protein